MNKIVLATNNKHKLKEFKEILKDIDIVTLEDIDFNEEIEETGTTFKENAMIKAKTIHNYLKSKNNLLPVIADDTGLCCDALDGAPGVYSARYAGDHDFRANRVKLIKDLKDKDKSAYFICTIAYIDEEGNSKIFEGKTTGKIIDEEKGDTGFGYDSIFLSDDLGKTFGESTEEEKNSVSHRGRAITNLKEGLGL